MTSGQKEGHAVIKTRVSDTVYVFHRPSSRVLREYSHDVQVNCIILSKWQYLYMKEKLLELLNTDMRRLTTRLHSEKCVVRRFRCCANIYLHKPR
jgi:hypothetical protein